LWLSSVFPFYRPILAAALIGMAGIRDRHSPESVIGIHQNL